MKVPNKKRTILFISNIKTLEKICTLLSEEYDFIRTNNEPEGLDILNKNYSCISLVIIDIQNAEYNNYHFLEQIKNDVKLFAIPVIAVLSAEPSDNDLQCLEFGIIDFIKPPYNQKLMLNTISNAIRIKDSVTFSELEEMLRELPSNIYLKDSEGKYIFATHYWHHLEHDDDPDWTIRGKTDVDIRKDRENALAALEKDKEIIATGKGISYVIEINTDGVREYFDVLKYPVRDAYGRISGIVGLINDITEHEMLKQKLQSAVMIDGLTNLYNRKEIQIQIEKTLEDSIINNRNFSLIMLDIDNFKHVNDTYGHSTGDSVIISLSDILRKHQSDCSEKISAGRWGGEEFMLLLRNTEITEAADIAEIIRKTFENKDFPLMKPQTISLGVTQSKAEDTLDTICKRVDTGLYKAKKEGKNKVIII